MAENKPIANLRNFALMFVFITAILIGTRPPTIIGLLTYLVFSLTTAFVYNLTALKGLLIGIGAKNGGKSLLLGIVGGFVFIIATTLIPGLSIGVPLLPNSIGDQLRFIIIIFFAPIVEEMFFRGALLGFFRNWFRNKLQLAIILQALLFALAHLGAYVSGFYDYSSITQGLGAVASNLSVFISAGLFGYLMGYFVTRNGIKNLIFSMVVHMVINFVIFSKAMAIFG